MVLIGFGLVVAVSVWTPYWEGLQTVFSLAAESSRGLSGFTAIVIQRVGGLLNLSIEFRRQLARAGSLIALGAVGCWLVWRLVRSWRTHDTYSFTNQLRDWAYVMLLLPVTMPRAQPWYMLTALALFAVVAPQARKGTIVTYVIAAAWFIYRVCLW